MPGKTFLKFDILQKGLKYRIGYCHKKTIAAR
jgi:hypothetical protein